MNTQEHEDETLIWSPEGNPSITALDRSKELFKGSAVVHFLTMVAVGKQTTLETPISEAETILTL